MNAVLSVRETRSVSDYRRRGDTGWGPRLHPRLKTNVYSADNGAGAIVLLKGWEWGRADRESGST